LYCTIDSKEEAIEAYANAIVVIESYHNYLNGVVSNQLTDIGRGRRVGGDDSESVDMLRKFRDSLYTP
jgi:hypothetical protein